MNDLPRQSHPRHHRRYHTNDLLPSMTGPMKMTSMKFQDDDKIHMTLLAIGLVSVCQKQRFHVREMVCLCIFASAYMPSLQLPISDHPLDKLHYHHYHHRGID